MDRALELAVPSEPLERRVRTDIETAVRDAANALSFETVSGEYFKQGEFIVLPRFVDAPVVAALREDFDAARGSLVRRGLGGYKQSASLGGVTLRDRALAIDALYRSAALISFLEQLTDTKLSLCPEWDAHACAVYHYERAGDGIGFHYDTSWYRGARYTVLIGLTNESSAKLVCDLLTREPQRATRRVQVATDPGTMVVFHGDKVWHAVSRIGEGEQRTVLTLQYVTDKRMSLLGRAITVLKDAMAYFGLRDVVRTLLAARGRSLRQ